MLAACGLLTLAVACIKSVHLARSPPYSTVQYIGYRRCNATKSNALRVRRFQSSLADRTRFFSNSSLYFTFPPPVRSNSIYIPFSFLQTRSETSKSSIRASTARAGGISRGKRMHNGVARSNVSPRASVKNVRRAVSVSSARQPFVRICEGKYRILRRKYELTKPSTGSTASLTTTHHTTKKMVRKTAWNYDQR